MCKQTEIERFAQAVIKNDDYRKQIHALGSDLKAVVRVANEHGYDLSMDDFNFIPNGDHSESQGSFATLR
jgi:hypothetical protein